MRLIILLSSALLFLGCGGGGSKAPTGPPVTIAWSAANYTVDTSGTSTASGSITVTAGSIPLPDILVINVASTPTTTDGLAISFPMGLRNDSHVGANSVTFPVTWTASLITHGTTATYPYGTTSATATYTLGNTDGTTTPYQANVSITVQ